MDFFLILFLFFIIVFLFSNLLAFRAIAFFLSLSFFFSFDAVAAFNSSRIGPIQLYKNSSGTFTPYQRFDGFRSLVATALPAVVGGVGAGIVSLLLDSLLAESTLSAGALVIPGGRAVPRGRVYDQVSGWVDPITPPTQYTPTAGTKYITSFTNECGSGTSVTYNTTDPQVICTHYARSIAGTASDCNYMTGTVVSVNPAPSVTCRWTYTKNGNTGTNTFPGTPDTTCNSGYCLSSGKCNLNETSCGTALWSPVPTNKTALDINNSNKFVGFPRDPGIASLPSDIGIGTDTLTRTGVDVFGNPISERVVVNPDGGIDYRRESQTVGPNGQPMVYRDILSTTKDGITSIVSSTPIYNTTINNTTTPSPTEASPENLEMLRLLGEIKGAIDDIPKPPETPPPDVTPSSPSLNNRTVNLPMISDAGEFNFSASCPPSLSFTVFGRGYTVSLESVCTMADYLRPLLLASTYLYVLRIILMGISF